MILRRDEKGHRVIHQSNVKTLERGSSNCYSCEIYTINTKLYARFLKIIFIIRQKCMTAHFGKSEENLVLTFDQFQKSVF